MKTLLFILLAGLAIAQTPQPGSGAAAGGCAAAAGTANAVLVDSSGCPSDSAITIIPGSYAGGVAMPQGTDPGTAGSWPANSAGIVAPSSVGTAYRWMMPAADANGFILSSGAGTPGVLSIVGFSGTGNVARVTSPTFVTPALGAATATSLLASGNVDGTAPVTVTTGASATLGGTYKSGYTINEDATAAAAITYTLPTAAAGLQYCVGNAYNGSAANTGTLEILTSAAGQFIIFTDGTLSATGGYVISGGAAGDFACVVGVDATHWLFRPSAGTWAKH